ncbi:hypothetical protein SLEP1_g23592 [Rubroshorea leprosula]|uniref:Barwin domain-containing protein n=1 Tax=Rubroshorea leprosula TaxID=152421 RepID=A0AAV5JLN4_9ROSI|nr:hypothetical protein SLEP1_g23592 [Rubroshorea leprosula]
MFLSPQNSILASAIPQDDVSDSRLPVNRHKRRWRMAYTAIYFMRALLALSKKALDSKKGLLRSPSYIVIDVPEGSQNEHPHREPVFNVEQRTLTEMVKEKSFELLTELGGVKQVATLLNSNVNNGIKGSGAEVMHRTEVFGANKFQKQPAKSFPSLVLEAFKDTTIIILLVCAILALAFGIKQHGPKEGWYGGGSISLAVVLVVVFSAVSKYNQNKQFEKLSEESSDIRVQVVRGGRHQSISILDVVVGDIVSLKIGDQIPADGLFVAGHSLKIDEASMTAESDHVEVREIKYPFLLAGTKVTDGFGYMLVTSVGVNTAWGEMMSSIQRDLDEQRPLKICLNKLTSYVGRIRLSVAVVVLLILLVRYFTGHTKDATGKIEYNGSNTKLDAVMNSVLGIIAAAVTIVVVAIPEGLPLAVTLTLACYMKRMVKDNATVSNTETKAQATVGIVNQCSNGGLYLDSNVFDQIDTNGNSFAQGSC